MSCKKKLQKSAVEFRKNNPALYRSCCRALNCMADYIRKTGVTDVIAIVDNSKQITYAKEAR